mmetsp:Transcript_87232/g.194047  ORF Transcript_87232/g.194047 Transcript_87232/m.194047 type:complete len:202 (+) Transcript_87232:2-607(+)
MTATVPTAMLLLAVLRVAVIATMATMAGGLCELCWDLRLQLDVLVDKVRHVVRAHVCQLRDLDPAPHSRQDLRVLVDFPDAILARDGLVGGDEVQLVQDNLVGEGDLLVCLVDLPRLDFVVEPARKVLCVCHRHHTIETQVLLYLLFGHESAHNGHRVGHASGLNDDLVVAGALFEVVRYALKSLDQVAADRAAHAAVVHD